MAGRIPEHILDDILSRVDIVEVISGYIPLKKAGSNFRALCPFHHEKTPSFMISPARQIYHCFGCGVGGNVFNFLMKYERLEFPEAVEMLAKKSGITLPAFEKQDQKTTNAVTELYTITELAAVYYEQNLHSPAGTIAKNYLSRRGITPGTAKVFRLGLALDKWDGLLNYLRAKNVRLALLEKSGLILPKEGGGYYDRFRNRLMFCLFDIKARPVGFGARTLDEKDTTAAKYINSPETPLYSKGKTLYGFNFTKDAIRENDRAVIVEGYLDLMIPYQQGLHNIVASLGTALTYEQVRLLKRYTRNVVMVYDPDNAGQMATLRTLDIFLEEDMNVRIVSLPQGFDPDLFVRKHGIDKFKEKIGDAEDLFDYQLRVLKTRYDISHATGKKNIFSEMLPLIRKVKNAIVRSEYIKKLVEEAHVPEFEVRDELNKLKEARPYSALDTIVEKKKSDINPTEKLLVKLMLEENELIHRIRECLTPADFQDERTAKIVSGMFELLEQGRAVEANTLISHFSDDETLAFICESAFMPELSAEHKEEVVEDCIQRLKNERAKLLRKHLHEEIKTAQYLGDEERLHRLTQEFHQLIKKEHTT